MYWKDLEADSLTVNKMLNGLISSVKHRHNS